MRIDDIVNKVAEPFNLMVKEAYKRYMEPEVDDITSSSWHSGEVRTVRLGEDSLFPAKNISVLKNPTQAELNRWAGDEVIKVRWSVDSSGHVAVWSAYDAIHRDVASALNMEPVLTNTDNAAQVSRFSEQLSKYLSLQHAPDEIHDVVLGHLNRDTTGSGYRYVEPVELMVKEAYKRYIKTGVIQEQSINKQDRIYLRIAKIPGHSGYGKYRVRGIERVSGGWDVTIQSWSEGQVFYPEQGRPLGMMLILANGMPVSAQTAFEIVNKVRTLA